MCDVDHRGTRDNNLITTFQPHRAGHPIAINGRDFATRND
jgi:hypothetical protein